MQIWTWQLRGISAACDPAHLSRNIASVVKKGDIKEKKIYQQQPFGLHMKPMGKRHPSNAPCFVWGFVC